MSWNSFAELRLLELGSNFWDQTSITIDPRQSEDFHVLLKAEYPYDLCGNYNQTTGPCKLNATFSDGSQRCI